MMGDKLIFAPLNAEWRVENNEDGSAIIKGHAAVFNKLSDEICGFQEKIAPGAFTRTIKEEADVRALWNHDPNFVLGRTKSGTLRLAEDKKGLAIEIDAPRTQTIEDLVLAPIRRGDVDQMSFGFMVREEKWEIGKGKESDIRILLDVDLFDVSPVTFPAYPQTDVSVRKEQHDKFRAEIEAFEREQERLRENIEYKCREMDLYV